MFKMKNKKVNWIIILLLDEVLIYNHESAIKNNNFYKLMLCTMRKLSH